MTLDIHPGAARQADSEIVRILDGLTDGGLPFNGTPSSYAPDRHITGTLGPEDLVGPVVQTQDDRFGREVARAFLDGTTALSLAGAAHDEFLKVCSTLQRQPSLRKAVSVKTVLDLSFEWLVNTKRFGPSQSFCAFILERARELIKDYSVSVPLFGLHVAEPLEIGHVTITDISRSELSQWRTFSLAQAPKHASQVNELHDRLAKRLAGLAAARIRVFGERRYAIERAFDETELSVAILRLYSIGAFAPEKPTLIAPLGGEATPRRLVIAIEGTGGFTSEETALEAQSFRPMVLDHDWLLTIAPALRPWSRLLSNEKRTAFENDILKSVLVYSRATRYGNVSEKLLHIFAAVESLLLRNDTEPIGSTISDRIAFVVGKTVEQRLAITRNVRAVYGMRSRYVHHAIETEPKREDLAILEAFLVTISSLFGNVVQNASTYTTRDSFIDAVERRKYA